MRRDRLARAALALLLACGGDTDAPTAIRYDHEACAHCHMLIGDARYAAQLVTDGGDVLDFDDPGCLITYLAEAHPRPRHLWFRDARGDRWLDADHARFVTGAATPMGYGLAAVSDDTPGAITLADARARLAARPR
jgi:copper chaperone NosL